MFRDGEVVVEKIDGEAVMSRPLMRIRISASFGCLAYTVCGLDVNNHRLNILFTGEDGLLVV